MSQPRPCLTTRKDSFMSDSFAEKRENMKPGDPLHLLSGISDMFVSYEPHFGFENSLEFDEHPKKGWKLLSETILNKFAPRHSIFLEQLRKRKEEDEIEDQKQQEEERERKRKRRERRISRKQRSIKKAYFKNRLPDLVEERSEDSPTKSKLLSAHNSNSELNSSNSYKSVDRVSEFKDLTRFPSIKRQNLADGKSAARYSKVTSSVTRSGVNHLHRPYDTPSKKISTAQKGNLDLKNDRASYNCLLSTTSKAKTSKNLNFRMPRYKMSTCTAEESESTVSSLNQTMFLKSKLSSTRKILGVRSLNTSVNKENKPYRTQSVGRSGVINQIKKSSDVQLQHRLEKGMFEGNEDTHSNHTLLLRPGNLRELNISKTPRKGDIKTKVAYKTTPKRANQSVCPFTEAKLINQVYVKNKIPNIDQVTGEVKHKKRFRKGSKVRRLDKNKIRMKKHPKSDTMSFV